VREVDYDRARDMFDPDVVGFGTFAAMLIGREALIDGQWKNIWGCTRGFRFLLEGAHLDISTIGDMAFVAIPLDQRRPRFGGQLVRPPRPLHARPAQATREGALALHPLALLAATHSGKVGRRHAR
jgi:hypothetical protein